MQQTKKVTLEKLALAIDQLSKKMDKGFLNMDQNFERKTNKGFLNMEQKFDKNMSKGFLDMEQTFDKKMSKGFLDMEQNFDKKMDKGFLNMEQKLEKKIDDKIEGLAIIVKKEFDQVYKKLDDISYDVKNLKKSNNKLEEKQNDNAIRLVFLENGKRFMENEQDKIKARISKLEVKNKMGVCNS